MPYSALELEKRHAWCRANPRASSSATKTAEPGARARSLRNVSRRVGYTDVALLAGGNRGWAQAGYALFKGVNVPSKLFGELVEHACHTPRVTVQELARMKQARENFVIVDGRPFAEYTKMNIPGGICCPNAELPYRIREIVAGPGREDHRQLRRSHAFHHRRADTDQFRCREPRLRSRKWHAGLGAR